MKHNLLHHRCAHWLSPRGTDSALGLDDRKQLQEVRASPAYIYFERGSMNTYLRLNDVRTLKVTHNKYVDAHGLFLQYSPMTSDENVWLVFVWVH